VREGDEPASAAEQADAAAGYRHYDPREQPLLLHRPVTPIYSVHRPRPLPTGVPSLAAMRLSPRPARQVRLGFRLIMFKLAMGPCRFG